MSVIHADRSMGTKWEGSFYMREMRMFCHMWMTCWVSGLGMAFLFFKMDASTDQHHAFVQNYISATLQRPLGECHDTEWPPLDSNSSYYCLVVSWGHRKEISAIQQLGFSLQLTFSAAQVSSIHIQPFSLPYWYAAAWSFHLSGRIALSQPAIYWVFFRLEVLLFILSDTPHVSSILCAIQWVFY